jgi:hypothetical protein
MSRRLAPLVGCIRKAAARRFAPRLIRVPSGCVTLFLPEGDE